MYIKTPGIVLNRFKIAEADKLVTVYSREYGKLKAIAPGARKINARLSSATEPLVETNFMFYGSITNNTILKIVGGELITLFPKIRSEYNRYLYGCNVIEIVDALTMDYSKNETKYNLIKRTLDLMQNSVNPDLIYYAFILRFLNLSGYGLDFADKDIYNIKLLKLSKLSGQQVDTLEFTPAERKEIALQCKLLLHQHLPRRLKSEV